MPCACASSRDRDQVLLARLALDRVAQPLAGAVERGGQGAVAPAACSAATNASLSRSGRSDDRPTSPALGRERLDDLDDLRVIADRGADQADLASRRPGSSSRMRSIGTMRMPPLVERRITQYVQPREQPRSASIRNMSRELGVRRADRRPGRQLVVARTGRSRGSCSPCSAGTKQLGIARASASRRCVLAARTPSRSRRAPGARSRRPRPSGSRRRTARAAAGWRRSAARRRARTDGARRARSASAGMPASSSSVDHAGQLELVGHRERDDRKVADRPPDSYVHSAAGRRVACAACARRRAGTRARRRGPATR